MTQGVTGDQTTTAGHSSVEGNSGNPSFIPSIFIKTADRVDYSHPLFLSPADISGVNLISFQLTGIENYALWSRSIKLALLGRNKIGLVDGSCKQEDVSAELRGQWERVNAIVLSWLLNSVSKSLLGGVAFASSAQAVWNDLKERFDQLDGSRTFSLHKDIATLQQGTDSVSVYFTKLKTLWDEFETLVPPPGCNCEKSRGFVDHLNRQKLYQFLMGLNESFGQARSQILLMNPIPTVNHAYAMVVNDECQKMASSRSSIGLSSMGSTGMDPLAMYSRTGGGSSSQGVNKFKRNFQVVCDFCRCKGHTKDQCYKLIGYPSDFKSKRKVNTSTGTGAYMVGNDVNSTRNDYEDVSGRVSFNYGGNTNVPVKNHMSNIEECSNQLQGCNFTKDQYSQILQMLKQSQGGGQNSEDSSHAHETQANTAGALHWQCEGS
ncbi:uncharacterized protein [Solanum tuberosum]|uniref:uncharacterized protein n=1 Tax=Solanum tuberosum TaxID=4113 RepID=UPI00073A13FE|nr:PREDICTED: uncharacterized protein LOC107060974 [Solanum tuberosum]